LRLGGKRQAAWLFKAYAAFSYLTPWMPLLRIGGVWETTGVAENYSGSLKRREVEMNKNLYIGNLSNEVTEEDLKANFSEVGAVLSVTIIKDKYTGLTRGFGFVEMETEKDAQEAIKKFNGGQLHGKVISVNEARPKRESGGPGQGGSRPGGGGRRY
jgi:RNA recognition motif-containing protein